MDAFKELADSLVNISLAAGDQETWVLSLDQKDPLEMEMATCPSILAWRIPWTEEPGWLQSIGSHSQTQLSMHAPTRHALTVLFVHCLPLLGGH